MQGSSLTVSLIAPMYGVERYIEQFAESVLSQSYPHIEFIFVNDGTKDRSVELLESLIDSKYSHLRSRIKIIHQENSGLPAARRTGLEHATGDYVYHVDSDDWLELDAVESMVEAIERTGADIAYCGYVKEYESRSKVKLQRNYATLGLKRYIVDMYNHRAAAAVWNKCVRRSLYVEHTIATPRYSYAEDCFLMSQLVGYARSIVYVDKALYHYRKGNPNAITRQQRNKRKREYALNFIDLYERYASLPATENPIAPIMDDIAIQLGWYSMLYGLNLFKQCLWLSRAVRKAKIRFRGSDVMLPWQLLTKLVALFR